MESVAYTYTRINVGTPEDGLPIFMPLHAFYDGLTKVRLDVIYNDDDGAKAQGKQN